MACVISVDSVTGLNLGAGGRPRDIAVSGTVQGCKLVTVSFPPFPTQTVTVVWVTATLGKWTAVFNAGEDIACGALITVEAYCATNKACTSGQLSLVVDCCPSAVTLQVLDATNNVVDPSTLPCLPPGVYTIRVAAPAVPGQSYYWSVNGNLQAQYTNQSTINYTVQAGIPTDITIAVLPPAGVQCPPLSGNVHLLGCTQACPDLTGVVVAGCSPGKVTLTAQGTNLGLAQEFDWTFGDGTPPQTSTAPAMPHTYVGNGAYTATVIMLRPPGCSPRTQVASRAIPQCGTGTGRPDVPDDDDGGGGGCGWRRILAIILLAAAAFVEFYALCVPAASAALHWIAAGLAAAAAALLVWYALDVFCKKPCGWWQLVSWQAALGAALAAVYYTVCCPALAIAAAVLGAIAAGFFWYWVRKCHPTGCRIIGELGFVVTGLMIPILQKVGFLTGLAVCTASYVTLTVGIAETIVGVSGSVCLTQRARRQ